MNRTKEVSWITAAEGEEEAGRALRGCKDLAPGLETNPQKGSKKAPFSCPSHPHYTPMVRAAALLLGLVFTTVCFQNNGVKTAMPSFVPKELSGHLTTRKLCKQS